MSFIIGIAGPSAGGKTTVTQEIVRRVHAHGNSIAVIGHDNYYKDQSHLSMEERTKTNYDHPHAFETDLLINDLKSLRNGNRITIPTYDFTTHTRSRKTETIENNDVIIVEGILTLENEQLRDMFDLRIFVETDADECLIRRIIRDTNERGRDLESVLTQYRETVKPMLLQFIEPSKRNAHIIVPNSDSDGGVNHQAIAIISNHLNNLI